MIEVDNSRSELDGQDADNGSMSIHLAAGWPSDGEGNKSSERSVAVVLKSARPVRWLVSSSPTLSGPLLIVTEHPIVDAGLSPRQRAELRVVAPGTVPDSFPMLVLWVTSDLGPPVSYVKTPPGTRHVELVINRKQLRVPTGIYLDNFLVNIHFGRVRSGFFSSSSTAFTFSRYLVMLRNISIRAPIFFREAKDIFPLSNYIQMVVILVVLMLSSSVENIFRNW